MALDPEFKKQTANLIETTLELYKTAGDSNRIQDVWGCKNTGDFLCGFFVGEMMGSALSVFHATCKREPTKEEHLEIAELIESYSVSIKDFFFKLNSK